MVFKILALGFVFTRNSYLREPWNILDFTIIVSGYLPYFINSNNSINFSGLRSLRVLRPLRTVTTIRNLRSLIFTIFNALPYLLEIIVVLIFAFLIFAIAGLQLFSGLLQNSCILMLTGKIYTDNNYSNGYLCTKNSCPVIDGQPMFCGRTLSNPDFGTTHFDNIYNSFLMVYVVTTTEGWTYIMSDIQRAFTYYGLIFFIAIIFIATFFLINLTLAVVTIKFNESKDNEKLELEAKQKHGTLSYD